MKRRSFLLATCGLLAACSQRTPAAPPPATTTPLPPTFTPSPTPTASATPDLIACRQPVVAPTLPAVIPGYAELDETTNLHVTGFVQHIDAAEYRLRISGKVKQPLELTYEDLRCLPKTTQRVTIICPGFFEDVAVWSGTLLGPLLEQAGLRSDAVSVSLVSQDKYESFLLVSEALREDNFLAYEWEGEPLPILHGFPVRAIMPSFNGAKSTKWLVDILVK